MGEVVAVDSEAEQVDGVWKTWCVGKATATYRTANKGDLLASGRRTPVFHSAKYDLAKLRHSVVDFHDTILQAHLLGYKPLALVDLASTFLGVTLDKSPIHGKLAKIPFDERPDVILNMCSMDAWATAMLHERFYPQIRSDYGLLHAYDKELRITRLLIDMEQRGMPISESKLKQAEQHITRTMALCERELKQLGINPADREVVAQRFWRGKQKVLHTKGGEKSGKKLSTKAQHLRDNAGKGDEWIESYIKWGQADKFASTYLKNWRGRSSIHPNINQTGTVTGRFSCSNPNLQNVPKKNTDVPLYHLFVAPEGHTFVSADYSQVELRVLANLSGDTTMQQAYLTEELDLHKQTMLKLDELGFYKRYRIDHPDIKRRYAKDVNFGISYGITARGLAPRLHIDEHVAQELIDGFYAAYPKVKTWQKQQVEFSRKHGYVLTHDGRPLYNPCILASRGILASHGEKQALDFPVQGGAMEIIKDGMLRCPDNMCMQVHDELLYLVPSSEANEYARHLEETLIDKRHQVPYTVEVNVGRTWGEIKHLDDVWVEEENE